MLFPDLNNFHKTFVCHSLNVRADFKNLLKSLLNSIDWNEINITRKK